jgi:hypothetical protein
MNTVIVSKPAVVGLLFLFTLISGVWLSHSGKPLNGAIFTIHKLIALATVIVVTISVYNLYKGVDLLTYFGPVVTIATGLLFLALFITGALLSLNIQLSGAALKIHQVAPLLAALSTAMTIYLLASGRS